VSLEVKRSPINELYFSSQAPRTEQFNVFPPSWAERDVFAFQFGPTAYHANLNREVTPPHGRATMCVVLSFPSESGCGVRGAMLSLLGQDLQSNFKTAGSLARFAPAPSVNKRHTVYGWFVEIGTAH